MCRKVVIFSNDLVAWTQINRLYLRCSWLAIIQTCNAMRNIWNLADVMWTQGQLRISVKLKSICTLAERSRLFRQNVSSFFPGIHMTVVAWSSKEFVRSRIYNSIWCCENGMDTEAVAFLSTHFRWNLFSNASPANTSWNLRLKRFEIKLRIIHVLKFLKTTSVAISNGFCELLELIDYVKY